MTRWRFASGTGIRAVSCAVPWLLSGCAWAQGTEAQAHVLRESFDAATAGPLASWAGAGGTWSAATGHAEIHAPNHRSAPHALRLFGGEEREVELELATRAEPLHELVFWAERWTRRAPFEFSVEARVGRRWREVYRGDDSIRVGGFLTEVRVSLDGLRVERLRFRCTAPEGGGVILDDVVLSRPAPMRVVDVRAEPPAVPLLRGEPRAPLARIVIDTAGNQDPIELRSLEFFLNGDGAAALDDFEVRLASGAETAEAAARFGSRIRSPRRGSAPATLAFSGAAELRTGRNVLWLSASVAAEADLDATLRIACGPAGLGDERFDVATSDDAAAAIRFGVRLRDRGVDGVHTYRIPGLVTSNEGTLLAVYDLRHDDSSDLPGDIDVGLSRSTDGGRSWEPMRTILDMGRPHATNGVGDPAILVDPATGRVFVAALWSHGDRGWNGSGPGLEPQETGQFVLVHSDDDGRSWSKPRNLTAQLKDPTWRLFLQGPGRGIATRSGALVFAAQFRDADGLPHSTVIHSRDHGETWGVGTPAKPNTTEAQVAELGDGSLMLNMRDNRGGARSIAVTSDFGRTWTEHASSRSALPEPVCMASLLRVPATDVTGGTALLAFSNPAVDAPPRRRITVKLSADDGATWPKRWHTLLDAGSGRGYSCLTVVDAETLGILYESSQADLVFQRLPLATLPSP